MNSNNSELTSKVESFLKEEVSTFELKGNGSVNNAYYVETKVGNKYIVKQEKETKEFEPQNTLVTEAQVAQKLFNQNLSIPIPKVVFVSEDPVMYGYEYVEGDLMRSVWESLEENERISVCQNLGIFHAQIGKKITREEAEVLGVKIDMSADLHPEVINEYNTILLSDDVPDDFKTLAMKAREIFNTTLDETFFQFIHNDAHHENILIKDKKISGFIDFGNSEYGEIAKEFSRYIRDFPDYFSYIVDAYEEESGNKLSNKRLVTSAFLSGLMEIVEDYRKGGDNRIKAEADFRTYEKLIN